VYIDDVVDGILAAGRSEQYGEKFLLLGPEPITFKNYVLAMCRALDVGPPKLSVPYALAKLACYGLEPAWLVKNRLLGKNVLGDKPPMTRDTLLGVTADRVYDTSKGTRLLGHTPRVGVEEGLRRTVDWLIESGRLPGRTHEQRTPAAVG
jgi:nucleoside-diphosphate-sugar epimerase